MTFIEETKKEFFKKFIGQKWDELELAFLLQKINQFMEEKIQTAIKEYDKETNIKYVMGWYEDPEYAYEVREKALARFGLDKNLEVKSDLTDLIIHAPKLIKEVMETKTISIDDISDDIGTTHKDAEGVVIKEEEEEK